MTPDDLQCMGRLAHDLKDAWQLAANASCAGKMSEGEERAFLSRVRDASPGRFRRIFGLEFHELEADLVQAFHVMRRVNYARRSMWPAWSEIAAAARVLHQRAEEHFRTQAYRALGIQPAWMAANGFNDRAKTAEVVEARAQFLFADIERMIGELNQSRSPQDRIAAEVNEDTDLSKILARRSQLAGECKKLVLLRRPTFKRAVGM